VSTDFEVVFSFDTTGSMYPCLGQVRRRVGETVTRLFKEIPGLRVGIIAHGDYCDASSTYLTRELGLTTDVKTITDFVENVSASGGGDAAEAYEYVLWRSRQLPWTATGSRVLVMIGDEVPHTPNYPENKQRLDWRKEADALKAENNVTVYAVQALNRRHADSFYRDLANRTGGYHLALNQFSHALQLLMAVCYKQQGDEALQHYEQEVVTSGQMNRSVSQMFDTMLARTESRFKPRAAGAAMEGRFQVLDVDGDISIRECVEAMGATFKPGRGFYEFTKASTIQPYKEIIMIERETGDTYTNEAARDLLGIAGETGNVRLSPSADIKSKYQVFIQSTSYNRKLIGGTKFMYEVEDWDKTGTALES